MRMTGTGNKKRTTIEDNKKGNNKNKDSRGENDRKEDTNQSKKGKGTCYGYKTDVSNTLGFENKTETWVVSVSSLETTPLKTESQSQCLRQQIKSLSISLTV